MSTLCFNHVMKIEYSEPADVCYFSFKCVPKETARQKIQQVNFELEPYVNISRGTDSFGNIKLYGTIHEPHVFLQYHVWGEVSIEQLMYEDIVDENTLGMFLYSHGKNVSGDAIHRYFDEIQGNSTFSKLESDYEKAIFLREKLYEDFTYESGVTNVDTTAEQAWSMRKGVCQDYAHIYIALLHLCHIPARYVTGMLIGEGKSHAWVEFCWQNKWIGVDPTNNLLVDDHYIKIADGRDAGDCELNRGIMFGGGLQKQKIQVSMWKEQ